MKKITATDLARNLRAVLDQVNETGEEYVVERGRRPVARVSPSPGLLSADEAMADLYRTISPEAAEGWIDDARRDEALLSNELRNPWDS